MRTLMAILLTPGLFSCGEPYSVNQVAFEGIKFKANLSQVKSDDFAFLVSVKNAIKNLNGAREAGRYEATKFCIERLSTSDIEWINSPDIDPLLLQDGNLELSGRCAP